jgi:predicted ATPase with chaperone activity
MPFWICIDTKTVSVSVVHCWDRVDLHVEVPAVEYKTLSSNESTEGSDAIRQRVGKARAIQRERFAKERHLAGGEETRGNHVLKAINYRRWTGQCGVRHF